MPTYGYQCKSCKFEFSVFQSMKDEPIKICPECKSEVVRLLYPVGIVFKGSGWYINDSRKPEAKSDVDPAASTPKSDADKDKKETPSSESTQKKEDSSSPATATNTKSESAAKSEPAAAPK